MPLLRTEYIDGRTIDRHVSHMDAAATAARILTQGGVTAVHSICDDDQVSTAIKTDDLTTLAAMRPSWFD